MKTLRYITLMLTCLFCLTILQGQVTVTIENLKNEKNTCTFDVYLHTDQLESSFHLGHSDFVFDLADQDLQTVTFQKVKNPEADPLQAGFCNFRSQTDEGYNSEFMQMTYFNNTSCMVKDGKLFINIASPAVSDNKALMVNTALIDDKRSAHRLGKFQITGLQDKVEVDEVSLLVGADLHSTKLFEFEKSESFPQRKIESVFQGETQTAATFPKINTDLLDEGGLHLKVYPNPSTDFVNVNSGIDNDWVEEIQIVNEVGQIVNSYKTHGLANRYQVDIRGWPNGAYFVTVTGNDKQETLMFQKIE